MIRGFNDTARLAPAKLYELLVDDRIDVRLWASWRLGALAGRGTPIWELVARSPREPDSGTRTLMVAMLGRGDAEVAIVLGQHDPSPDVRGKAMQLVTRLATDRAVDAEVVVASFEQDTPQVRAAILGALGAGAPAILEELAQRGLVRQHPHVQLEAFQAVLRIGTAACLDCAIDWIADQRDYLATKGWDEMRRILGPRLVPLLATRSIAVRVQAIAHLRLPIAELDPLLREPAAYAALCGRTDLAEAPLAILAHAALAGAPVTQLLATRLGKLAKRPTDPVFDELAARYPGLVPA